MSGHSAASAFSRPGAPSTTTSSGVGNPRLMRSAQARFDPAIHPLQSYSDAAERFASWWSRNGNPSWVTQRETLLTLLEQQASLERMARIVGKDALPPAQQLTLVCAELVNEGPTAIEGPLLFLRRNVDVGLNEAVEVIDEQSAMRLGRVAPSTRRA